MRIGHHFQGQKVKGQGHQAALLTVMLERLHQPAAAVAELIVGKVLTVGTEDTDSLLLRCALQGRGIVWRP